MRPRRGTAARTAAIALGVATAFGIIVAWLAPPQVSQGTSFPAPAAAAQPRHKQSPPAQPVQPPDATKCNGNNGKPGPSRIYAADTPGLEQGFAGPALVDPPVTKDDSDFAVIILWDALCQDPVNAAVFAARFDGKNYSPVVLYNNRQWENALDSLRFAADWNGYYRQPRIEWKQFPKSDVTDYMVPHPVNGVPDVGYINNPDGKQPYLGVYDWSTGGYVWISIKCMQPMAANAPPAYLHATGGQLRVAVHPQPYQRTTSG